MSRESISSACLRLALPKGRMEQAVLTLLGDAGIRSRPSARGYRPEVSLPDTEAKTLKPQNIVEMLSLGSRDLGFAGADWVAELEANVVELLDTGLDPVQVVAAAPEELLEDGAVPARPLAVASEYELRARSWIDDGGLQAGSARDRHCAWCSAPAVRGSPATGWSRLLRRSSHDHGDPSRQRPGVPHRPRGGLPAPNGPGARAAAARLERRRVAAAGAARAARR